jgi:hypothetical protein
MGAQLGTDFARVHLVAVYWSILGYLSQCTGKFVNCESGKSLEE